MLNKFKHLKLHFIEFHFALVVTPLPVQIPLTQGICNLSTAAIIMLASSATYSFFFFSCVKYAPTKHATLRPDYAILHSE